MSDPRGAEPPPEEETGSRGFGDHLLEYARDSSLWPVLMAGIGVFVTLGAAVLLAAFSRNLFAMLALLLLVGLSVDAASRELRAGGFGPVCGLLTILWALSAAAAAGVAMLGWH